MYVSIATADCRYGNKGKQNNKKEKRMLLKRETFDKNFAAVLLIGGLELK